MGNGSFHHVSPDPNQDGESVGITQDSVGNQPNLWENIDRKKEHNQTVNQRPRWRNTLQRIEEECVSPDANEDGESVATTQDSVDNQPNLRENIEEHNQRRKFLEKIEEEFAKTLQRIEEECASPDANKDGESVATTQDSVGNQPNLRENIEEQNQRRKTLEKIDEEFGKKEFLGIRITGAIGVFSCHINSVFVDTGNIHNKCTLYQSLSSPNHWLWYALDGRWMVSHTEDMQENGSFGGFCYCTTLGLTNPSFAKRWKVLGQQGMFRIQTQVVATKMTREEVGLERMGKTLEQQLLPDQDMQQKRTEVEAAQEDNFAVSQQLLINQDTQQQRTKVEAAQDELPVTIKFQGATGLMAHKINGVYKCQKRGNLVYPDILRVFRRCYPRTSKCSILSCDSSGRWKVMQGPTALAYCDLTGLSDPCDATRWYIANSVYESCSLQPAATARRCLDMEIERAHSEVGATSTTAQHTPDYSTRSHSFPTTEDEIFVNTTRGPSFTAGMAIYADKVLDPFPSMDANTKTGRYRGAEGKKENESGKRTQKKNKRRRSSYQVLARFSSGDAKIKTSPYMKALAEMQKRDQRRRSLRERKNSRRRSYGRFGGGPVSSLHEFRNSIFS